MKHTGVENWNLIHSSALDIFPYPRTFLMNRNILNMTSKLYIAVRYYFNFFCYRILTRI